MSEVSQSVTQKKERNGQLLQEHAASKLDISELIAKQTDTFLGDCLLDRKGEGSYEESSIVKKGLPLTGAQPVHPPRKHVVEYMQKILLLFLGTSSVSPDLTNLSDLLESTDSNELKLPTKWTDEESDTICTLDATDYLVMRSKENSDLPDEWWKANQADGAGKRRITMTASNSMANLNEIRSISCLTVSKTTVWRALKANPFITRERMRECPTLTADHKKARMAFARTHISWTSDWTEAILPFSIDEKKFDLDGPDGFTSCWRDLRKERRFPQKNFIFQQDNAVIHVSCGQKDWFRRRNIVLMDWPSRSPDLNPMKNLWEILTRQVYAHNKQLSSIEDLKKTVSEEWSKSDPAILKNVSTNMTEGIFQVRGGPRDALVVHATENSASVLYQEAFLVTYRTFISSHDLINKLVKRYLYMVLSKDRASQSASRHTFSVIVRVVDELTSIELTQALVESVTSFVYRLIQEGNLIYARLLR
uniref:N-terminal Ras-GEF domain-containing protein n=1 Tax=Heterorhabditis bacteriophora TaxID=37862 RepID=A0A1I7WRK9_HETBA